MFVVSTSIINNQSNSLLKSALGCLPLHILKKKKRLYCSNTVEVKKHFKSSGNPTTSTKKSTMSHVTKICLILMEEKTRKKTTFYLYHHIRDENAQRLRVAIISTN